MTKIPWTDETWNPVVGCTKIATGCENCYAEKFSWRLACMGKAYYNAVCDKDGWNGNVLCREDVLEKPLHWRDPRKIFVCSMSDLFHEKVPFEFIDKVHAIAALCPQHTFQLLTKRIERAAEYYEQEPREQIDHAILDGIAHFVGRGKPYAGKGLTKHLRGEDGLWPPPNVWLGTSISTQADLNKVWQVMKDIPAAIKYYSVEPMLENVEFEHCYLGHVVSSLEFIDWVIIGCESGPNLTVPRPCKLEWVEDLISQCDAASVPVFVKQLEIDGKLSRKPKEWPKWAQRDDYPKGV